MAKFFDEKEGRERGDRIEEGREGNVKRETRDDATGARRERERGREGGKDGKGKRSTRWREGGREKGGRRRVREREGGKGRESKRGER